MWGVKGIDHVAKPGCLACVLGGSYPSGPSSAEPPEIWKMITSDAIPAYNVPSGILLDIHREAAAKRSGFLTKVGMDTQMVKAMINAAEGEDPDAPIEGLAGALTAYTADLPAAPPSARQSSGRR